MRDYIARYDNFQPFRRISDMALLVSTGKYRLSIKEKGSRTQKVRDPLIENACRAVSVRVSTLTGKQQRTGRCTRRQRS